MCPSVRLRETSLPHQGGSLRSPRAAGPALLSPPRSSPSGTRAAHTAVSHLRPEKRCVAAKTVISTLVATLAQTSKITAPTSRLIGQVYELPDAPEAYGAMITRTEAASAQTC